MLMELVAQRRIVEVIGEVVEEIETALDDIGVGLPRAAIVGLRHARREREAVDAAAVTGIFRIEAAQQAAGDGTQRNLVRRIPAVAISHRRRGKAVGRGALRVADHTVELAHLIRIAPGSVVDIGLSGEQQIALAQLDRVYNEPTLVAEAAECHFREAAIDAIDQIEIQGTGRAEVAFIGVIRSLADAHTIDRFRHQEVEIGIALAMPVGAHVDRHVIDRDRHVGAMVEVVAAQEILVGLSLAAVLGDDQPGRCFQHFAGPRHRAIIDLLAGHGHLACHRRCRCRTSRDVRRACQRGARRNPLVIRVSQRHGAARGGTLGFMTPLFLFMSRRWRHLDRRQNRLGFARLPRLSDRGSTVHQQQDAKRQRRNAQQNRAS